MSVMLTQSVAAQAELLNTAPSSLGLRLERVGLQSFRTLGLIGLPLPNMLVFAADETFLSRATEESQIVGVIVPEPLLERASCLSSDWWLLVSDDPKVSFWDLHLWLYQEAGFYDPISEQSTEIDPTARIAPTAVIGRGARIGCGSVVEEYVVISAHVQIGDRVRIGPHSIIGAEGFQNYVSRTGQRVHVPHVGTVVVADDVCIHSHVTVDRALWGSTQIGSGTQIDNLCHIAHNCILGHSNVLTAGTVLGGSVVVGDESFFGIGAVVKDGLTIGSRCRIPMGGVVVGPVPDGEKLAPLPALEPTQIGRILLLARQHRSVRDERETSR